MQKGFKSTKNDLSKTTENRIFKVKLLVFLIPNLVRKKYDF